MSPRLYISYFLRTLISIVSVIFTMMLIMFIFSSLPIPHSNDSKIREIIALTPMIIIGSTTYSLKLLVAFLLIYPFVIIRFFQPATSVGYKPLKYSGFIYLAVALLSLGITYLYASVYESKGAHPWVGKLKIAQISDLSGRTRMSPPNNTTKEFCTALEERLKTPADYDTAMKNLEDTMAEVGAKLVTEQTYISRAYISYYFKPTDSDIKLEDARTSAEKAFKLAGIGPTFYWLNREWYKNNNSVLHGVPAEIEGKNIRIRFETLYPVASDYFDKNILHKPPEHLLKAARDGNLEFVRSARLDPIGYMYSIPMPRGYANIRLQLFGKRDETNPKEFDEVMLRKIDCTLPAIFPAFLYDPGTGLPPSSKNPKPTFPQEIPHCAKQKTPPYPVCPTTISFPPGEY